MYIHIGADKVVGQNEIIGIFDLDTSTVSRHTRDFLSRQEKTGNIEMLSDSIPESFVLCDSKIYFSAIKAKSLGRSTHI